jgi:hypothetical protein
LRKLVQTVVFSWSEDYSRLRSETKPRNKKSPATIGQGAFNRCWVANYKTS